MAVKENVFHTFPPKTPHLYYNIPFLYRRNRNECEHGTEKNENKTPYYRLYWNWPKLISPPTFRRSESMYRLEYVDRFEPPLRNGATKAHQFYRIMDILRISLYKHMHASPYTQAHAKLLKGNENPSIPTHRLWAITVRTNVHIP